MLREGERVGPRRRDLAARHAGERRDGLAQHRQGLAVEPAHAGDVLQVEAVGGVEAGEVGAAGGAHGLVEALAEVAELGGLGLELAQQLGLLGAAVLELGALHGLGHGADAGGGAGELFEAGELAGKIGARGGDTLGQGAEVGVVVALEGEAPGDLVDVRDALEGDRVARAPEPVGRGDGRRRGGASVELRGEVGEGREAVAEALLTEREHLEGGLELRERREVGADGGFPR